MMQISTSKYTHCSETLPETYSSLHVASSGWVQLLIGCQFGSFPPHKGMSQLSPMSETDCRRTAMNPPPGQHPHPSTPLVAHLLVSAKGQATFCPVMWSLVSNEGMWPPSSVGRDKPRPLRAHTARCAQPQGSKTLGIHRHRGT
jgi:hypothetical protein